VLAVYKHRGQEERRYSRCDQGGLFGGGFCFVRCGGGGGGWLLGLGVSFCCVFVFVWEVVGLVGGLPFRGAPGVSTSEGSFSRGTKGIAGKRGKD